MLYFQHTVSSGVGCHTNRWRYWKAEIFNPPQLIHAKGPYKGTLLGVFQTENLLVVTAIISLFAFIYCEKKINDQKAL
jgi:hypothetical protein